MHAEATAAPSAATETSGGEGAQATLYGDIKPDPVSTSTFLKPDRPLLVPAYSGGRDGTAMLIALKRRGIVPDAILMANVGIEKDETYEYVRLMNQWCLDNGFPEITMVQKRSPNTCDLSIEDECLRLGLLPSIAYGGHSCSQKWKIQPQEYYLNRWEPAILSWKRGRKVVRAIGYEADECKRIEKAKTYQEQHPSVKYEYWHPLREWGYTLADCIALIKDEGLPVPLKSACTICSSSKKWEIEWLAHNHPDQFLRALLIERNAIPKNRKVKGLGRNFAWSSLPCAAPFLEELDWIMEERERTRQAGFIPLTRGARIVHGVTPPAAAAEWPVAA